MKDLIKNGIGALIMALLMVSCQMEVADPQQLNEELAVGEGGPDGAINARTSDGSVIPVLWTGGQGGNATCDDTGITYAYSSGRINFVDGAFQGTWPEGLEVTVSPDGKFVSWSYDAPEGKCLEGMSVIVKGGNASNIYTYGPGITFDSGLASPTTGTGTRVVIANLSNLSFCFNLTDAPEPPTAQDQSSEYCTESEIIPLTAMATAPAGSTVVWYTDETGSTVVENPTLDYFGTLTFWAESVKFGGCVSETRTPVVLTITKKTEGCGGDEECETDTAFAGSDLLGDPSWYYLITLDGNNSASETLWAGKFKDAGTVSVAPKVGDPSILVVTIELNEGFGLQAGGDNWYIHTYEVAPTSRPIGGKADYKGQAESAPIVKEIPSAGVNVLAVHVNVQECTDGV